MTEISMEYRRARVAGGCYFFTVALADRSRVLLVAHINELRAAFKTVKTLHPFTINAMVVLPEHDDNYSARWMLIKRHFSLNIPKTETIKSTRIRKRERGIWQRRFWEHRIRDERDFNNHIEYIHNNPIKHNYVTHAQDWPYSSIHKIG
ncbi:MAG TPA: transposase [Cellvibrionaceae bacterium]|nr:transposase [Cellvibrionaceae bacterium]